MRAEKKHLFMMILIFAVLGLSGAEGKVIELSWSEVAGISINQNLSLKMSLMDNKTQQTQVNKAWGSFLPSIDYQWVWSDDEFSQLSMPVDNTFMHSISLTCPLFTGGARYANLKLQKSLKRSLEAELAGSQSQVAQQGLSAWYGVILARKLVKVYQEAASLAESNLRQVESYAEAGLATELSVMQARTRYFEAIPQLANARSQEVLAINSLKLILNIPEEDSLLVKGDLMEQEFLGGYKNLSLTEYKILARENRSEIRQIEAQLQAVQQQKLLSKSAFLPTVALTAGRTFYAFQNDFWIDKEEFEAYNSVGLAVQMPLFNGGSRYQDYKSAVYAQKKMLILEEFTSDQLALEAEQAFYKYIEAKDNLKALEEALQTAEESLRLANLYYQQGMSTQTEVLNAQLAYTQNQVGLYSGIYAYNTSQLDLLSAIGDLQSIWQK